MDKVTNVEILERRAEGKSLWKNIV